MNSLRKSIHSPEHQFLRDLLKKQREDTGLTQRALAERMGIIYSYIGKVETGDRRLDVIEFIDYCHALKLNPAKVIEEIEISTMSDMLVDRTQRDP